MGHQKLSGPLFQVIYQNGSPRKGESKSNNRRDKKESKVVKIILVLF